MTGQASAALPSLAWHSPAGDEGAPALTRPVLAAVTAIGALFAGMDGLAAGDAVRAALLIPMCVMLLNAAVDQGPHAFVVHLRLVADASGTVVWTALLLITQPTEPMALATIVGLAAACAWRAWSLIGAPELWPAAVPVTRDGESGWIEELPAGAG
jgi:hypothetical protein